VTHHVSRHCSSSGHDRLDASPCSLSRHASSAAPRSIDLFLLLFCCQLHPFPNLLPGQKILLGRIKPALPLGKDRIERVGPVLVGEPSEVEHIEEATIFFLQPQKGLCISVCGSFDGHDDVMRERESEDTSNARRRRNPLRSEGPVQRSQSGQPRDL